VAEEATSAKIIDGKAISADIRAELKEKVCKLEEQYGKVQTPSHYCKPQERRGGGGSQTIDPLSPSCKFDRSTKADPK